MKNIILFLLLLLRYSDVLSQNTYVSYFTGDTTDVSVGTKGGIVLMGGAGENDNAMRWFLERSGGGDIVVIRTSGSDGYNDYFYSELGITVNSVQTIVMPTLASANDPYVAQQIRNAEALWIAGGDQYKYVSYWKNKPVEDAIRYLIHEKKVVVGGTSAGMAIQGAIYFDAANGTVTSVEALNNPYNPKVSIGYQDFLDHGLLQNLITDTHFDNPDRRGRLLTFLARMAMDEGIVPKAIASEEYTSVCIDTQGIARVYGDPSDNDFAYFIQANCTPENTPEVCTNGTPLTWIRNNEALKVYKVKGTQNGANTFNLNDWKSGSGGTWEHWWAETGVFKSGNGTMPLCNTNVEDLNHNLLAISVYPNPMTNHVWIVKPTDEPLLNLRVTDLLGITYLDTVLTDDTGFYSTEKWPSVPLFFIFSTDTKSKVRMMIKGE